LQSADTKFNILAVLVSAFRRHSRHCFTLQLFTLHWSQWTCVFLSRKICNELAEKRPRFCHWPTYMKVVQSACHGNSTNCFWHTEMNTFIHRKHWKMTDTHKNSMQLDWHRENSVVYVHFIVTVFSSVLSR